MTTQLTLENRLPAHAGALTVDETKALKRLWLKLFKLFKQKGEPYTPPAPGERNKGWFSKLRSQGDLFIGATTDPRWMSLSLDAAIPLIPGHLLETAFWNMVGVDNPDSTLLRFLRARKWDFDAAYNMLVNALRWRLYSRVDEIVALGETGLRLELEKLQPGLGNHFIEQIRSGKASLGGPDKEERGISFINVQLHHKEDQPHETIKLCTLYLMETGRLACAYPRETYTIVFNMENFTLANMDYEFVKYLLSCLESYYPETLGACLIHRAPWVFSTVWAIISPWIDPVVASKIHFTKSLEDITKYVDIDYLPVIISGRPDHLTKEESTRADDPPAGSTATPTTEAYRAYKEHIKEYEKETAAWAKSTTKENDSQDALARLQSAQVFRRKRLAAEADLRGKTIYAQKGMITLEDSHLYVDFGGKWPKQDITDNV